MDDAERRLLAELTAKAAEMADALRAERDRRVGAGGCPGWIDEVLPQVESMANATADLAVFQAIRDVVQRHGGGPYPVEDLAVMTGAPADVVVRVLDDMVREGLALPPGEDPS